MLNTITTPPTLNTSTFTDVGFFNTTGMRWVRISGGVGSAGALTDLLVSLTTAAEAPAVPFLSGTGGDFGTVSDFLIQTTLSPHTTVAGGAFQFALDLNSCCHGVRVQAKGNATTLAVFGAGSSD